MLPAAEHADGGRWGRAPAPHGCLNLENLENLENSGVLGSPSLGCAENLEMSGNPSGELGDSRWWMGGHM